MTDHLWISSRRLVDRVRLRAGLDLPPLLARVDAHRALRGPYTAAGALMRSIARDAFARCPELAARHRIEIASVAPELVASVPSAWGTLEWTVCDGERTRFYSRLHTLNIANGIAEFLRTYLAAHDDEPRVLVVENAHEADPTDQELLAVLLRRNDIPQLTMVVGTGSDPLVEPAGEVTVSLPQALAAHAKHLEAPASRDPNPLSAKEYVDRDGTSDDPSERTAYDLLPAAERAALHDARCAELYAAGEQSLTLGAIPHHAERGSHPATTGARALKHAMGHCRKVGLYQAAAELGLRGRAVVDRIAQPELWWHFTEGAGASLAVVGRVDEAAAIYDEARAATEDPKAHLRLAYSTALLLTRHEPVDLQRARGWMNVATTIAAQLPDPKDRAFHTVFSRNGLAQIEIRDGRAEEALRLLESGMAVLDRELAPDEHPLQRTVLRYNRAQVLAMVGRLEEALADYTAVAELDPDFAEHHFHVGSVLRRLGRNDEALAAFERVLPLSPPFPEVNYNIADTRLELGDLRRALVGFDRVLELDPDHVETYVNRAGLRCELGDTAGAWQDVTTGLVLDPTNVHLLCVKGKLLAEQGDARAAHEVLSTALGFDADFAEAWALRGEVRFEAEDIEGALGDFDRAVSLGDRPELRFNRAVVFEEAGRYDDAAADYRLVLDVAEDADARTRLDFCLRAAS